MLNFLNFVTLVVLFILIFLACIAFCFYYCRVYSSLSVTNHVNNTTSLEGCYSDTNTALIQSSSDYSTGSITQSLTSRQLSSRASTPSEENHQSKADIHDVYDLVKLSKLSLKAKHNKQMQK